MAKSNDKTFHIHFFMDIFLSKHKRRHLPQKLTKPVIKLSKLIKNGYSYDAVARSSKIAYFDFNLDSLIGSLHRK